MKRHIIGAWSAVFAICAACGSGDTDDSSSTAESRPETTAPATTDVPTLESDGGEPETADEDDRDDAEFAVPEPFAPNPAGTYEVSFGGGQLTLTAPEEFFFADLGTAVFFDDPANPGGASDYYGFVRPETLPTDDGSIAAIEHDRWVAGTSSLTVELDETQDDRWQVYRLTTDQSIPIVDQVELKPGELFELWFMDTGTSAPLVIMAKTDPSTPESLDRLAAIAASVGFDSGVASTTDASVDDACRDRPWQCGMIGEAPAGELVCTPALGAVAFEMSESRTVVQPNPWWILVEAAGAWEGARKPAAVLIKPHQTVDGEPLTTVEDLIEVLELHLDLEPIASRTFFGDEAAGYSYVADESAPAIFSVVLPIEEEIGEASLEDGFISPAPFVELWVVDEPDGPVIVSAAAWLGDELSAARDVLDDIAPTLERFPEDC